MMRTFFLGLGVAAVLTAALFGGSSPSLPSPESISYSVRYRSLPEPHLMIEARFQGGSLGFTVFGSCLRDWPGEPDCDRLVGDLSIRSAPTGEAYTIDQVEPTIWVVDHPVQEPLVVSYTVVSAPAVDDPLPFTSSISGDHAFFLADAALLLPEPLVENPEATARLSWAGPLPAGWSIISSFGLEGSEGSVTVPLHELRRGLVFLGPLQRDRATGSPPLEVVWLTPVAAKDIEREKFVTMVASVRQAVSKELSSEANDVTRLFVFPAGDHGISAVSLPESILFLIESEQAATSPDRWTTYAATIAHELVHASQRFQIGLVGGPVAEEWLTEALAEFLARRVLYRQGLIEQDDWARMVSEKLAAQTRAHEPRREDRGPDPYVLGDLVLITIDQEIRRASGGGADILQLVNRLDQIRQAGDGEGISWSVFLHEIAARTSPSFASGVDRLLRAGESETIELSDELFSGCIRVATVPRDGGREVPQQRLYPVERSNRCKNIL